MSASATKPKRLIVGISGASGIIYGIRLLEVLRGSDVETHLVMSPAAEITLAHETDYKVRQVRELADHWHAFSDIGSAISSGSFRVSGMIIAPCSVKTMSEIHTGTTDNLLSRAADVVLKERRNLILMVRETPLHVGHLRTMTGLAEIGAIIMPPVTTFYFRPNTIENMVDHTIGRALDMFDMEFDLVKRWKED